MGGKRNNRSSQGPDTSKLSNVVPYKIATRAEEQAEEDLSNFNPEEAIIMSEVNVIETIFGGGSVAELRQHARANNFFETERYQNFKRFYQQNPSALIGVVNKCFSAWKRSKFAIELDVLEQNNLYVADSNLYKYPRREEDPTSLLSQVAYTFFARNEDKLLPLINDTPDDGRGMVEIAETTLDAEPEKVMENHEFAQFWREVAYR